MRIIFFGNNIRGARCLEALHKEGFNITAVVVHHAASDENLPGSVHYLAKRLHLPVFDPKDVNSLDFLSKLRDLNPELMILCGYNQILKGGILEIPSRGTINLHGGYLPYYRGGSPINWQILNGETVGGCAIIYVDEGIDTGDIIAQELYSIGPQETAGQVIEKTLTIFPPLLVNTVKQIGEGRARSIEQDISEGTYYCKRYPWDGQIFWNRMTALQIHNLVRALNGPNLPGAFTFLDSEKIIIWKTRMLERPVMGPPGRIALKEKDGIVAIAADKGVLIKEVKVEKGQKIIGAKDFFRIRGLSFK